MINKAVKIDEQGYFVEDIFDIDIDKLPDDVITTPVPQPCAIPRWDGNQWIDEGQAEIDASRSDKAILRSAKAEALAELNVDYEAAARPLVSEYPTTERESWHLQLLEARQYQAWLDDGRTGEPPDTPALTSILRGRNGSYGTETMQELVAAVLRRAGAFVQWQEMTGIRQRGERLIREAETAEEAHAVTWESLT